MSVKFFTCLIIRLKLEANKGSGEKTKRENTPTSSRADNQRQKRDFISLGVYRGWSLCTRCTSIWGAVPRLSWVGRSCAVTPACSSVSWFGLASTAGFWSTDHFKASRMTRGCTLLNWCPHRIPLPLLPGFWHNTKPKHRSLCLSDTNRVAEERKTSFTSYTVTAIHSEFHKPLSRLPDSKSTNFIIA